MYECTDSKAQPALAATYWVLFTVVAGLIALSLFVGAVTVSMGEVMDEVKEQNELKRRERKRDLARRKIAADATPRKRLGGLLRSSAKKAGEAATAGRPSMREKKLLREKRQLGRVLGTALYGEAHQTSDVADYSSDCEGAYARLADSAGVVASAGWFNVTVGMAIVVAALTTGLETNAGLMRDDATRGLIASVDLAVLFLFTAECVVKVVSFESEPMKYVEEDAARCYFSPAATATAALLLLLQTHSPRLSQVFPQLMELL